MRHTIVLLLFALRAAAVVTVTFPNANLYTAPYACQITGGALISPTSGCYLKGVVSGTTSIVFNVDTTVNSGLSSPDMPAFRVTIDDATSSYVQLGTTDTSKTLASGMTTASHRFLIQFIGGATTTGNNWTGTTAHTKVTSIQFDTGSTLSAPAVRPNVCLFYGDSYLMTVITATQVDTWYHFIDFTQSYPRWIASALNCEYGQIGIGSDGWINNGNAGMPAFGSWWDHYDSTHARDLTVAPNYLVVAMGNNDHGVSLPTLDAAVTSFLTAMRAVWPTAPTYILTPFADATDAAQHAQIAASTVAYAGANSDHLLWSIDIGSEYTACLPFGGGATWCSFDGLHPSIPYSGAIASLITDRILTTVGTTATIRGPVNFR